MSPALFLALALALTEPMTGLEFSVRSADGVMIQGQADAPGLAQAGAVVMVAGTGSFDRDVHFSQDRAARPIFADLAERITLRGVTVVRYDKRGVRYRAEEGGGLDTAELVSATTQAQRDDLAAVYDWTRSPEGLNAGCVVLFGHSEGMAHIGRLASAGAPAPSAVVGMGALLTDPVTNFRWNLAERDVWSLRLMDADADGITTNEEVRAGLATSPAVVNGVLEPYLHPSGGWNSEALARLEQFWVSSYPAIRQANLALEDDAPWPNAQAPAGSMQWAKSWYLDEQTVASRLALWDVPVRVHLGERDSQTHAPLQRTAGEAALGARLSFRLHSGVGHTLGPHPTYGPVREDLAQALVEDIVASLATCSASVPGLIQ